MKQFFTKHWKACIVVAVIGLWINHEQEKDAAYNRRQQLQSLHNDNLSRAVHNPAEYNRLRLADDIADAIRRGR